MIYLAHEDTPAAILQALREEGLEVSPFVVYEGTREISGTIFDCTVDHAYSQAHSAGVDVEGYETYDVGVEQVPGVRFEGPAVDDMAPDPFDGEEEHAFDEVEDEEIDPFDDDPDFGDPNASDDDETEETVTVVDRTVEDEPEEQATAERITVRKESWVGWDYDVFRPAIKAFANKIGQGVNVYVPHGYAMADYEPLTTLDQSRVHLFIHSAPGQEMRDTIITSVLGHELRLQREAFTGPNIGTRFAEGLLGTVSGGASEDAQDHPVAWVFDDAIFIGPDLVHYEEDLPAFVAVLDQAADIFGEDEAARRERRRAIMEAALERQATAYAEAVKERARQGERALRERYERLDREINNLTQALIDQRRNYADVGRQLVGYEAQRPDPEVYKQEYLRLLKLPKVRRADMTPGTSILTIWTENLFCLDDRTQAWHDIGEFKIVIDADARSVHWFNETRQVDAMNPGMQAPHVFSDGHACYGNFSEIMIPLMEQFELANLATMAIAFIENANTGDAAGAHVNKWPRVDEDTALRLG